jgi:predicted MFS family arabinose efflux permease
VTVIIFTPLLTSITHRFRPLAIVASGGLFYSLSFLMFGNSKYLQVFFVATAVLTIGEILININTNIYIVQQTPQAFIGRANSMLSLINGAGIAVGPIIMGHVLLLLQYHDAWILVAMLMLCGSVAMFVLNSKKEHV